MVPSMKGRQFNVDKTKQCPNISPEGDSKMIAVTDPSAAKRRRTNSIKNRSGEAPRGKGRDLSPSSVTERSQSHCVACVSGSQLPAMSRLLLIVLLLTASLRAAEPRQATVIQYNDGSQQ